MIRTLLVSAALLALAGGANAATIKISVAGKTEAAVKAEIAKASQAACTDVGAIDYAPCVREAYQDGLTQLARIKALRMASLTF